VCNTEEDLEEVVEGKQAAITAKVADLLLFGPLDSDPSGTWRTWRRPFNAAECQDANLCEQLRECMLECGEGIWRM
jgi:hypothetical protein